MRYLFGLFLLLNLAYAQYCPGCKVRGANVGFWVAPTVELGLPEDFTATQLGGAAGISIRDRGYLGVYGQGLLSANEFRQMPGEVDALTGEPLDYRLKLRQGGLWGSFSPWAAYRFRFLLEARVGYASVALSTANRPTQEGANWVLQPGGALEFALVRAMRLTLGGGWRYVAELNLPEAVGNYSGGFVYATLRFGRY